MKDKYFNGWEEYMVLQGKSIWEFMFPNKKEVYVNLIDENGLFDVWDRRQEYARYASKWTVTQILRGIKEEKE